LGLLVSLVSASLKSSVFMAWRSATNACAIPGVSDAILMRPKFCPPSDLPLAWLSVVADLAAVFFSGAGPLS
jgi:hypothetical protein